MKKIIPNRFKSLVREAIRDYRNQLGFNHFDGDILYVDKDEDKDEAGTYIMATATVDHRYLSADFRIYPKLIERWKSKRYTDEEVKKIIAHEVAHLATHNLHYIATCPYKDEGETKDAWEALTEIVGRLLYRVNKIK